MVIEVEVPLLASLVYDCEFPLVSDWSEAGVPRVERWVRGLLEVLSLFEG